STRDCPLGPTQLPGRILARGALQVAKQDRYSVLLRKTVQLVIQSRAQIAPAVIVGCRLRAQLCFFGLPPGGSLLRLEGGAERHSVEPIRHQVGRAELRCLANQKQKGSLKRVLRGMPVAQNSAADAEDHRAMSAHQFRKRTLILLDRVPMEQLRIRKLGCLAAR